MATKKETIIIELEFDTSDLTKEAAKRNKVIKELTESQKELKRAGAEGSIQFQKNAEALRENKKSLSETNKEITNLNKANKSATGSNEQLKAQLSLQTAEYNKLSKAERENSERGKELNAQINQTTEDLKGNEEAVGNNRRSVGDYGKALSGTPFGSFIGGIKGMGAAFIANPLGIILLAIVGALKLLKEAFNSTEEGQNRSAKATAVLSTIWQKFLDILEPIASFIADRLTDTFEDLGTAVDAIATGVSDLLELMDFNDAADSLDRFVASQAKAIQGAQLVADARAKTDKLDRELIVETARIGAQAADARQKAIETENLSAEERNQLLNDAATAIDELAAKEEKSAKLKLKAIQLENAITLSNKEALDNEANAQADLFNIQKKRSDFQKGLARDQVRVETELKKIAEKRIKAQEKAVKDTIAQNKLEIDLLIASQGIRAKTLQEQITLAEEVRDKRLEVLNEELAAKLVSQTEFEIASLAIQEEFLLLQTEQVIENADRELQVILEANQSRLDAGQFLNDELFAQEQERLNKTAEAQREFEATRLEEGVITRKEFNDAINNINAENAQSQADLENEKKAADEEAALADLENQREIDLLNREDEFALRQEDLDRQKEQELANAESTGASKALIEDKFAKLSKDLDNQKRQAQISNASSAFGAIASLGIAASSNEKASAIASATINAFQGITAVLAAKSTIPEPFGSIAKGASAAAIGINAFKQVRKIQSTKTPTAKKAARGMGVFGGKPHSRGGTKGVFDDGTRIEVERGELFAVVNKKNTSMLNDLNSLNTFGGNGDPLFNRGGSIRMQDGGIALDAVTQDVEAEADIATQVVLAVQNLPNPVVAVQDINEVQSDTAQVEARAVV